MALPTVTKRPTELLADTVNGIFNRMGGPFQQARNLTRAIPCRVKRPNPPLIGGKNGTDTGMERGNRFLILHTARRLLGISGLAHLGKGKRILIAAKDTQL